MSEKEQPEQNVSEEMDSASRRDFMKVAGVGALGLAYINPVVETMRNRNWDDPQSGSDPTGGAGGSSSSSSGPSGSSSTPGDGSSSSSATKSP